MTILNNWEVRGDQYHDGGFVRLDSVGICFLHGNIEGHVKDDLLDGLHVHTSNVMEVKDDGTVQTKNTLYTLGEMSEEYARWLNSNLRSDQP